MTTPTLYSPSTGGFYLEGISSQIPDDAAPITAARHAQLLEHGGAYIAACPKTGKPVSTVPKVTATDRRAALVRQCRAEARRRILAVSPLHRQINDLRAPSDEGARRFVMIDAIRTASGLIIEQIETAPASTLAEFPISSNPLWPEL